MAKFKLLEKKDLGQLSYSAAKNYIDNLRREIRRHDYLYYVKDRPEIADEAYDRLFAALKNLENALSSCCVGPGPTCRTH